MKTHSMIILKMLGCIYLILIGKGGHNGLVNNFSMNRLTIMRSALIPWNNCKMAKHPTLFSKKTLDKQQINYLTSASPSFGPTKKLQSVNFCCSRAFHFVSKKSLFSLIIGGTSNWFDTTRQPNKLYLL